MKTLLVTLTLAITAATTASAQIYRPSVVGHTTVLGAVAGALIGGHNGDRWAEGAIIGAAAGAVIGAVVDDSRSVRYSQREIAPVTVVSAAPVVGYAPVATAYAPAATAYAPQVVYVSTPAPTRVVYVDSYPSTAAMVWPAVYVAAGLRYNYGYSHNGWSRGHGYSHGHGGHYGRGRR